MNNKQSASQTFQIVIVNYIPQIYQQLKDLKQEILVKHKQTQFKYIKLDQFINNFNVTVEQPRTIYIVLTKKLFNESILKKMKQISKSKIKLISYPNPLFQNFMAASTKMQILDKITVYKNLMVSSKSSKSIKMIGARRFIQAEKNLHLNHLIVNGLKTKNKSFNDQMNSIYHKYKNNPNIQIKEIKKIEDLLSGTNQKQILVVSHENIQKTVEQLRKIKNRKEKIHSILFNTSPQNKIVQIRQQFDLNTSTSSQIITQIEIYLTKINIKTQSNNKIQVQRVKQEYFGINTPNKEYKDTIEKSISPGGTSYRIRLNSAKKYTKSLSGSQSSKSLLDPNVLIFQNPKKEFIRFYQSLFVKPIIISSLTNNLDKKTIVIADYSDRKKLLNQKGIKNIGFIFYGTELQPDPVIVNPLVQLATDNVQEIRNYLILQNIRVKLIQRSYQQGMSNVFGITDTSNINNNSQMMKNQTPVKQIDITQNKPNFVVHNEYNFNQINMNKPQPNKQQEIPKNSYQIPVNKKLIIQQNNQIEQKQEMKQYKYQWVVKMRNKGKFFTFQKNSNMLEFQDNDSQSKKSITKPVQQIKKNQWEMQSNKSQTEVVPGIKRVSDIHKEKSSIIKNSQDNKSLVSNNQFNIKKSELKNEKSDLKIKEFTQVKKESQMKKNDGFKNQNSQLKNNNSDIFSKKNSQLKKQKSDLNIKQIIQIKKVSQLKKNDIFKNQTSQLKKNDSDIFQKKNSQFKKRDSQISQKKNSVSKKVDSDIIIKQDQLAKSENEIIMKENSQLKKLNSDLKQKNSQIFKKQPSQIKKKSEIKQNQIPQIQINKNINEDTFQKTEIKISQPKQQLKQQQYTMQWIGFRPKGSISYQVVQKKHYVAYLNEPKLHLKKNLSVQSSQVREMMQTDSILDEEKEYMYQWQIYKKRGGNQFLTVQYKQNNYQQLMMKKESQITQYKINIIENKDQQKQTQKNFTNHQYQFAQPDIHIQDKYSEYFDIQMKRNQSRSWAVIKKQQKKFELLDQKSYDQYEKQKLLNKKQLVKPPVLVVENKNQQFQIEEKQNLIIQPQQIDQRKFEKTLAKDVILSLSQDIVSHIRKKKPQTPGYVQNILRQSMNFQIQKLKESKDLNQSASMLELSIIHSKNNFGSPNFHSFNMGQSAKRIVSKQLIDELIYNKPQQNTNNKYSVDSIIRQQSEQATQRNISSGLQKNKQISNDGFPMIQIVKKQKEVQELGPNIKYVDDIQVHNFEKKNSYKIPKLFKSKEKDQKSATSLTQPISQDYDAENMASMVMQAKYVKKAYQNKKIDIIDQDIENSLKNNQVNYDSSQSSLPPEVNEYKNINNNNNKFVSSQQYQYQTRIQNGIVITSKKQSNFDKSVSNGTNNYYNVNVNADSRPVYYKTNENIINNKPQYIIYDSNPKPQVSNQNVNILKTGNQPVNGITIPFTNSYATLPNNPVPSQVQSYIQKILVKYQQSPHKASQKTQYGLNYTTGTNFQNKTPSNVLIKNISPQKNSLNIVNKMETEIKEKVSNNNGNNILYLIPQIMINERNKILTLAPMNDKVQTFSQIEQLKYIRYRDYNLVFIFQNDQKKKLPFGQNFNIYLVRTNTNISQVQLKSREIKIKDVEELMELSKTLSKKKSSSTSSGTIQLIFKKLNPIIQQINHHFSETEYKILKYYTSNELIAASNKIQPQYIVILITDQIPENIDIFRQYPYFTSIIIPKGKYKAHQTKYPKFKWIIQQNIQKILKQIQQYIQDYKVSAYTSGNSILGNINKLHYNILVKQNLKDQINLQSSIPGTILKYFNIQTLKLKLSKQKQNIVISDSQNYELMQSCLNSKDKIIIYLKPTQIFKYKNEKILLTHRNSKQIISFVKKILQQNQSVRKQKSKIFYFFEHVEIEEAVQKKFPFKFVLIKYNDYSSLSRKISEFSNDNMFVILNINLVKHITDIKNLKMKGSMNLIVYQKTYKTTNIMNVNIIRNVTEVMNEIEKNTK